MSETPKGKSTAAMQKLRANKEYKLKEDRSRLISRIRNGALPRETTLKKYNLTLENVNTIRNEAGFKKIKPNSNVNYTNNAIIQQEINENTKALREIEEQKLQKLQVDVWEKVALATKELDAKQEKDKRTYKGEFVFVDAKNIYSLENAKAWFTRNPGNVKRAGQLKDAERAKSTTNKIIDALVRLFTKVMKNVDQKNIIKNLTLQNVLDSLNSYQWKPNTPLGTTGKLTYLTALSIYLKEYPSIDVENLPWSKFYTDLDQVIQSKMKLGKIEAIDKSKKQKVTPFSDIVEAFKNTFGEDSVAYLYIQIYREAPTRDDLNNLKIFYEDLTDDVKTNIQSKNNGNNCIFIHNNSVSFALIKFKTDSGYKPSYIKFSSKLSKMIIDYLNKLTDEKRKKLKGTLFGTNKLTRQVGQWLKRSGIKLDKKNDDFDANVNVGNINLLRHSFVTEQLSKSDITIDERSELADAMKHSPNVSLAYVRDTIKNKNK